MRGVLTAREGCTLSAEEVFISKAFTLSAEVMQNDGCEVDYVFECENGTSRGVDYIFEWEKQFSQGILHFRMD